MAKTKPEKQTALVAVEILEELTPNELRERHRLELRVERAVFDGGKALAQLCDQRLYRSTHKTFEEYCQERFGFTRFTAYNKIATAQVYENLLTNGQQILPTHERQVRDLTGLEPELQSEVWQSAVDQMGGKVPSGRVVKGIVARLKEKSQPRASDFCAVGDVFTLTRLEGSERKYNGCWAIATNTEGITVGVDVHDGSLRVNPFNLKPIDSPEVQRQLPEILKRIKQLRDCGMLDRCAYTVLESLGRQTYLTSVEEGLLQWLEKYYLVDGSEN